MVITCPACRKKYPENQPETCTRCGCDLVILRTILLTANQELHKGIVALHDQNGNLAIKQAIRSWNLKKSLAASYLGFFASLLLADQANCQTWYARIKHFHS